MKKAFLLIGVAAFSASPTAVMAQSPSTGGVNTVDEIIVTAQRRAENLQDVPIAVSAYGGETLERLGIDATNDLPQVVPGLLIQKTGQAVTPFLRGVGSQAQNPGNDPSIATYIDGVYQVVPFNAIYTLTDIERIEVLKGPQGTLFGRNATGGLINIITKDPQPGLNVKFRVGFDNFETVDASGYIAGGTEQLAASLSVLYSKQNEGWGRNLATPEQAGPQLVNGVPVTVPPPKYKDAGFLDEFMINGKIVAKLGEDTRLTLTGRYFWNLGDQGEYRRGDYDTILSANGVTPYVFTGGFWDEASDLSYFYKSWQYSFSGTFEHDFSFATFKSISSYTDYDSTSAVPSDSTPQISQTSTNTSNVKVKGFTQELQLLSNRGPVDWIVGLYYLRSTAGYLPTDLWRGALEPSVAVVGSQLTKSYSGFGQVSFDILPETRVTAGVRYTKDKFDAYQFYEGLRTSTIPMPFYLFQAGVRTNVVPNQKTSQDAWTYKVALDHRFTPDVLAYASYSRGYKAGGFNVGGMCLTSPPPIDACPSIAPPVEPETLNAFEGGLKSELFDRKLRLNLAGFYYDYADLQIQVFVGSPPVSVLKNAASAEIYGGELEGQAVLGNFDINFGIGVLQTKFKDFPDAPIFEPNSGPPYGNSRLANANLAGNKLLRAPKFTSNIGVTYTIPISLGEFSLNGNYYHNSGFFWDAQNRLKQEAYDLFNAKANLSVGDNLDLSIWGRNLTNKKYYSFVRTGTDGDQVSPAAPRTYGVTLQYNY